MDPATPTTRGRRRPRWARALLIQGCRVLWRMRAAAAPSTDRKADSPTGPSRSGSRRRLYAGWLQLRRFGLRLPHPSAKNRAWGVAALTGTAGIILLFLMYLAGRDATAAAATPQVEPPSQEEEAEPARLLAFEDEPPPLFEPDPAPVEVDIPEPPEPEPLLSLESALLRLPDDSADEFDVQGLSSEDRPIADPFAALPPDDWVVWVFPRSSPAADPVLYADRLSPDLVQQLSAEMEVAQEPAEVTTAENELNVAIARVMPEAANAGDVLSYELVVRNEGEHELTQATVEEHLPPAYQVVDASPPALLEGQTLRWQVRELPAGEEQRITIQVLPTEEGSAKSVAAVQSSASVAASTLVQSIRLELEANVPERVHVGERCAIEFRITNTGTAPATGVVLRNDIPEPLAHALGRQLDFELGTLAPGQSRELELPLLAAESGTGENVAEVVADGDIRQQATGNVDVVPRSLRVRRWGVPRVTIGQPTVFENHVINEGDQPLTNVELVEAVPAEFEVVDVPGETEYDEATRQVRWTIAAIEPGSTAKLPITLRAMQPGELRTILEARCAEESRRPVAAKVEAVPPCAGRVRALVPCCR